MRATLNGEITLPCTGSQYEDDLAVFSGLLGIAWDYWGLLGITGDYLELLEVLGNTEDYLGLFGIPGDYCHHLLVYCHYHQLLSSIRTQSFHCPRNPIPGSNLQPCTT